MTAEELRASAQTGAVPPEGLSDALLALWHDAAGDWDKSHTVAQEDPSPDGSRVHAYLHRKEGDPGNARYWYNRAGQPEHRGTLDQEWAEIAAALLTRASESAAGC